MHAYGEAWERLRDYDGVSNRSDFWLFALVGYIIIFLALLVDTGSGFGFPILTFIAWVIHIPAYIPLAMRRLRDAGYDKGAIILVTIISFIGPGLIAAIICFAQRSARETDTEDRWLYKGVSEEKAKSWKDQKSLSEYDTIIQKIEKLSSLHQAGHISDDEYEVLRKSLTAKL